MSVQLGATPSPVSPPYSHHHLHHHQHSHLSHSVSSSVLSNQQHSLSGRGGGLSGSNNNKRSSDGRNSSDCNDNLTSSGFDSDRLDLRWNFANASAQRFGGQCQKKPKIRRFDDDGQSSPPEIFRRWKQFLSINSADSALLKIRWKPRRQFQSR